MNKYLYIVIGVIWLASNLYKSFRKKEADKTPNSSPDMPPERKEKNIETILEEILTGKPKPEKPISHPPQPAKLPKPKKQKSASYSQELTADARAREINNNNTFSYETPSSSTNNIKNIVQPVIPAEAEADEITFDIKNAIIYSEIIGKPKYLADI